MKNTMKSIIETITKTTNQYKTALIAMLVVGFGLCLASAAQAMTAPVTGDFGFVAYDLAFNDILAGPGGWVVGGAGLGIAGWSAVKQQALPSICAALGTGLILKLEDLLTSFGMLM